MVDIEHEAIFGFLEDLNKRLKAVEKWKHRQTEFAEKVWEDTSPEDKAKAEANLKRLGING